MKQPPDGNAASGPNGSGFDPAQANLERMQAVFAILREEADYSEEIRRPRPAPAQPAQDAPNETVIVSRPHAAAIDQTRRPKGGAGVYLFFVFALIALASGAVYGHRLALSEAFPQFAPAIETFAAYVQQIKSGLRGFLSGGS